MNVLYWVLILLGVLTVVFLLLTKKGIKIGKKKEIPQDTPSEGTD